MATSSKDLMSTQTGGFGETIQSSPESEVTAEQFNIKLPKQAQASVQPSAQPEAIMPAQEIPAAPVAEVIQPQAQEETSTEDRLYSELNLTPVNLQGFNEEMFVDQPRESAIKPQGSYTEDGLYISEDPSPIVQPVETKTEEVINEEPMSLITEDGLSIDSPEQNNRIELEKINTSYKDAGIKIDSDGVVRKVSKDDKEKPNGTYVYAGQPDAMYKKVGKDKWLKDYDSSGNFLPIEKDAARRIALLERDAKQVGDGKDVKSKASIKTEKNISERLGNVTDFNANAVLTASGSPMLADNISFNTLIKKNIGSETERYNQDGTLNFNYDEKKAAVQNSMPREVANIVNYKGKPDGIYSFPGSDASYKKSDNKWYKAESVNGKYQPLTEGDVDQRVESLEKSAYRTPKVSEIATLRTDGQKLNIKSFGTGYADMIDETNRLLNSDALGKIDSYDKAFEDANEFINKDVNILMGDKLSQEQKDGITQKQQEIKKIIGDGKYDISKAAVIAESLKDVEEFFNASKAFNVKVNEGVQQGKSLARMSLDNKKKTYLEHFDLKDDSNIQTNAKELFEITSRMADFVLDNIDNGKMRPDTKNGGYIYSPNLSSKERNYIESKLISMNQAYDKFENERYSATNDRIIEQKSNKENTQWNIEKLEKSLAVFKGDSSRPEYQDIYKQLLKERKKLEYIDIIIDDEEISKSTVFLTEPKKLVQSVSSKMSPMAENIFNAIPSNISPKQRFDFYYEQLQEDNNKLAKDNNLDDGYFQSVNRRAKDLFAWEGFYQLSDVEKTYLQNVATLNQMSTLYYNNDTGFTKESTGFFESLMNGIAQTLTPETAKADGYFSKSEMNSTMISELTNQGFDPDGYVDPATLQRMEERTVVDFISRENLGKMAGSTVAIITPLILTGGVGPGIVKLGVGLEKLLVGVEGASKVLTTLNKAEKIYDATLSTTKLGRFLLPVSKAGIEQGIKFEIGGTVVGSTEGELNWFNGLAGGILAESLTGIMAGVPKSEAYKWVSSIFGNKTNEAVDIMKSAGKISARGVAEIGDETGSQLASIYSQSENFEDMMATIEEQYGSLDKVEQFLLSTFVMGSAFGIVSPTSSKDAYFALPDDKKARLDKILAQIAADVTSAEKSVSEYAQYVNTKKEKEEIVDKIVDKPIVDDKENEPGVSGEVEKGKEPIQAEPIAGAGKEEVSTSGVVQGEPTEVNAKEVDIEQRRQDEIAALEAKYKIDRSKEPVVGAYGVVEVESESFKAARDKINAKYDTELATVQSEVKAEEAPIEGVTTTEVVAEPTAEVIPEGVSKPLTEEEVAGKEEVESSTGLITIKNPIKVLKGLFGKKNVDGSIRTAHPDVKGTWGALDEAIAKRYKGEDEKTLTEFSIPAGTTVETIEIDSKGKPVSQIRQEETDAVNNSTAQVVRLVTMDSGSSKKESQIIIKDETLSKAPESSIKEAGKVTDENYVTAQEVNNNISKANPDASVLLIPKGNDLSLTAVYVGKDNRGKGIGTKVLETVKSEADRTGKKIVLDATNELDSETDLKRLGSFYEKNGFKKVGENKFEYNPQEVAGKEFKSLADKIRAGKIEGNDMAMSAIPGFKEVFNTSLEVVATAVDAGLSIAKAITEGFKTIKQSQWYKDLGKDQRAKAFEDYKNGMNEKFPKKRISRASRAAAKGFKAKVDEVTGTAKEEPTISMTNSQALREQLKNKEAGAKDAVKFIQGMKEQIRTYAKENLPKELYSRAQVNLLMNAISKAKTAKSLDAAITRIDKMIEGKAEAKRIATVKAIVRKIKNKREFLTKVNNKWKGKTSVESQKEFKEFINSGALDDLELKTQEELDAIMEIIDSIIDTGKADFKTVKTKQEEAKRKENAILLKGLAKTPDVILNGEEEIVDFLENGGAVIIDGQLYKKAQFNSLKPTNFSNIEGYKAQNISFTREAVRRRDAKPFKRVARALNPLNAMSDIYSLLKGTWAKSDAVKKYVTDNIEKPLIKAMHDILHGQAVKIREYYNGVSEIFGSKKKGIAKLSETISEENNPIDNRSKASYQITNSHMVNYYNLSRVEDGVRRLASSGVDPVKVAKYMDENQDLKDYADFLIKKYDDNKVDYEPVYEAATGMPFPEKLYYPEYASNFEEDFIDINSVLNDDGSINAMSAVTSNIKQRTAFSGQYDINMNAHNVYLDYIKNMEHSRNLFEIAKKTNQLFSTTNAPFLISNMGLDKYNELRKHMAVILSNSIPKIGTTLYSRGVSGMLNFSVLSTLGFKPASVLKQFTSFTHYWTAGIADGVDPWKIVSAIPKSKEDLEFWKSLATSDYIKDRMRGGSLDVEAKKVLDAALKSNTAKGWVLANQAAMSPIIAGDLMAVLFGPGGGSMFALATYRQRLSEGMSKEDAYDYAYRRFVEETEKTQQSTRVDLTSNIQRDPIWRMAGTYRTGQASMAKKVINAVKLLNSGTTLTTREKAQAITDIVYFTALGSVGFSVVASGAIGAMMSSDDDEDKRITHDIIMDQLGSDLQGYGAIGHLGDWTLNAMRGDIWKNNIPVVNFIQKLATLPSIIPAASNRKFEDLSKEDQLKFASEAGAVDIFGNVGGEYINQFDPEVVAKLFEEYNDQMFWSKLTEAEARDFYKSIGSKNINDLINNMTEYIKGDKELLDALMNYEDDYFKMSKERNKVDHLYKLFTGEDYLINEEEGYKINEVKLPTKPAKVIEAYPTGEKQKVYKTYN